MLDKNNPAEFEAQDQVVEDAEIDTSMFKTIEVSGGATMVVPANMPKFKMRRKLQPIDIVFICAMLAIPVIMFLVFFVYLNISNIVMAFTPTMPFPNGEMHWWSNFAWAWDRIFYNENRQLIEGTANSFLLYAKDTIILPFNVVIAYFLYKKVAGYKFFQVIFYMPGIISGLVMVASFKILVNALAGMLESAGNIEASKELLAAMITHGKAFWMMMIYSLWLSWGGSMLLLGGAMARIPVEVIESGRLDGITSGREIVSMIFPLIWSTLSTLLILHTTSLITAQGSVLVFDPENYSQTWTIGYWIFYHLGGNPLSGDASSVARDQVSALGLIFTAVGVPVVLFLKWIIERVPVVEY